MRRAFFPLAIYDWLGDINLRSCHPLVRGIAMDLICFCFQGEPRGYLRIKTRTGWTALHKLGTPPPEAGVEFAQNDPGKKFSTPGGARGGLVHQDGPPDGVPGAIPTAGPGALPGAQYNDIVSGLFVLPANGAIEGLLPVMLGLPPELLEWSIDQLESRSIFLRGRDGILYYPPIVEAEEKHLQRVKKAKDAYMRRTTQATPISVPYSPLAQSPPAGQSSTIVDQDGVPSGVPHTPPGAPVGAPPDGVRLNSNLNTDDKTPPVVPPRGTSEPPTPRKPTQALTAAAEILRQRRPRS